jgi:erythrin-vacuolar iron transport family protein
MAHQAPPIGATNASLVARGGPVGAATQPGFSGFEGITVHSLRFRQQPHQIAPREIGPRRSAQGVIAPPLPQAAEERTDALPSHRYSRPRYRPSAHALNAPAMGRQPMVSGGAAATGMTLRSAGATATVASSMAATSPAVQLGAGVVNTLLSRIEADERAIVLRYVQPGLVGLIDGTLSTLAPIFAVAVLSSSHAALLVGLATALGAGISMGLSEALSDDGGQTGRGSAITRGSITGVMTTVGGVFHALPFLISDRAVALMFASIVVAIELMVIALIRKRYLEVSLRSSLVQIIFGGVLIVGVGLWLGGL